MDQSLKGQVVSDYKAKSCRSCCLRDKAVKGLLAWSNHTPSGRDYDNNNIRNHYMNVR